MYRFFTAIENVGDGVVRITGDDVNHIKNVLRMTKGEKVVISCGQGIDYYCIIDFIQETEIGLLIEEEKPAMTELPTEITLFQALPKSDKMELIVQKAVELGSARIVPVKTKRCVVKLDEKKAQKKVNRWNLIAESAAKQSGRAIIPKVSEVMSFSDALQLAKTMDTVLIPYELSEDMAGSVQAMQKAAAGKSIGIFIGPEGGFERGEVELAIQTGALAISLGKRILRTETAGLATMSVLMFMIEGRNEA